MSFFSDIQFAYPLLLLLLLIVPLQIGWYIWKRKKLNSSVRLSTFQHLTSAPASLRQRLILLPFILRMLATVLLIVCLARPQSRSRSRDVSTEGIDIVLSMDISGSMLAEDFKPNRIEAAKKIAAEFVKSRPNDRMGLVAFAGESFTSCPLTTDHTVLLDQLQRVEKIEMQDGTAVGEGLAMAVARIKDSKAKSRVIILLTDGVNNLGVVAPLTAAEIAKTFGIRVYTVGIGTKGLAPYPVKTPFGVQYQNFEVEIDEPTMKQIATITGGRYYRATGNAKLREVYQEIDKLERSKIKVTEYSHFAEEFLPFAMAAAVLLALELLLRYTWLRSLN